MHPIQDVIRVRKSIRTYDKKPLSKAHQEALLDKINQVMKEKWLVQHGVSIHLITAGEVPGGKLGTYGVIKGAKQYLCVLANPDEEAMVAIGYGMEQVILHATVLGLATCWLGGTFSRGQFSHAVTVPEGKIMPIVSPVGYPAARQSLMHQLVVTMAKSRQRMPWEKLFFQGDFHTPLTRQKAKEYAPALDMVQLAPSASNGQPWRILKNGSGFHFYRKQGKSPLPYDIQAVDVGIAVCHFALTAREMKLPGEIRQDEVQKTLSTDEMKYICTWA